MATGRICCDKPALAKALDDDVTTKAWASAMAHMRNMGMDPDGISARAGNVLESWADTSDSVHPGGKVSEPRFRVLDVVGAHILCGEDVELDTSDWRNFVVEQLPGGGYRLVAIDGGEPEDQTLARDFSWVVTELNRLAAERAHVDRAVAARAIRWASGELFTPYSGYPATAEELARLVESGELTIPEDT